MSDDLDRVLRNAMTRLNHVVTLDLLEVRQWYYDMSEADRERFKKDLRALVAAAKAFDRSCMTVKLEFRSTWHCGEDSLTQEANRTPQEILAAIEEWDAAPEKTTAIEL